MASFRLFVGRGNLGPLTLYGPEPNSFDGDALPYGEILAQHAAVAMADAQAADQLHRAIASRDVIGQAKGIIMERFHVDAVRAFEMLTRLSQESNVKLLEVAENVLDTTADQVAGQLDSHLGGPAILNENRKALSVLKRTAPTGTRPRPASQPGPRNSNAASGYGLDR